MDYSQYHGCVYETTNHINGKKYIGKLIFSRQNDWEKYLGSGLWLKRAISKYGKENFSKKILALASDDDELNCLEESLIEYFDAVSSPSYYNIKKTAMGGDIFTYNPRKEEIREMRREQMSGKGNNQYGKPKTDKMIDSVKEANSKRISVDGVEYESISECHRAIGLGITTISYRVNSSNFPSYHFIDHEPKPAYELRPKNIARVLVDGVIYNSAMECAEKLGVAVSTIRRRVKNENFPNYVLLND